MNKRDYLAEENIKKTKQRKALLEILETVRVPLTASQIHALYQKKEKSASLSTTYRILDLFCVRGITEKIISSESDSALYELSRHKHYAVCRKCHKLWDLKGCPVKDIRLGCEEGFHVTGHRLEVYGYCDECYKQE